MNTQRPYIFLIKITFFALVISAIPLPEIFLDISPFWMLLFYTYWISYLPAKSIFSLALILGILLDILQGGIMGQNALALILSSAFIAKAKQSFFVSNVSTQQVYVFVASVIYLASILIVHILTQDFNFSYYILIAPLSSAIFWSLIRLALINCKHQ